MKLYRVTGVGSDPHSLRTTQFVHADSPADAARSAGMVAQPEYVVEVDDQTGVRIGERILWSAAGPR